MKSIKILITVLALGAVAFVSTASAQEKGKGQMGPAARVSAIEEAVGSLSAEQKTKITAILEKSAKDLQAIPQDERREKGREVMMAANKEVRAVLTVDQQAKFDAMAPQGGKGGGKKKN